MINNYEVFTLSADCKLKKILIMAVFYVIVVFLQHSKTAVNKGKLVYKTFNGYLLQKKFKFSYL